MSCTIVLKSFFMKFIEQSKLQSKNYNCENIFAKLAYFTVCENNYKPAKNVSTVANLIRACN